MGACLGMHSSMEMAWKEPLLWQIYRGDFYKFPVHQINNPKKVDMNSFVISGLSLHLADCHSVTMPALLPHAAQPSAKEILQKFQKDNL